MRRASVRRLFALAGALVFSSVARADAPQSQYATFDQADAIITDNHTGLAWQRAAAPQQMKWDQAAAYCAALSLGKKPGPWRLPSYKELLTLVDESPHTEYEGTGLVNKFIDSHAFGFLLFDVELTPVDAPYWSSSLTPSDAAMAFVVDFKHGTTLTYAIGSAIYVRCVHD
jgi:hypothetical protein